MNLGARIGRASRPDIAVGEVRAARVAAARKHWEEIPETRLVARGFGLLVDAETDSVYVPCRGTIFERGSARLVDERTGLAFYLDGDGWPVALERRAETWTQLAYRQARRQAS